MMGVFEKELGKVRGSMPLGLQALKEEGSKSFKVTLVQILPKILMESPVDESVEDTWGLRRRGRPV